VPSELWPPTSWPRRQQKRNNITGTLAASLPFAWVILDMVSDGRLDNAVRFACSFGKLLRI
jgi:hypothetical protein